MLEVAFKSASNFFSNLTQSLLSLAKILVRSRWDVSLPAPEQPYCSVLGNGPSLSESLTKHLDFLLQTELVCVNFFAATEHFTRLRPTNYVLADPNCFTFNETTVGREDLHQILAALINRVDWPMRLFIPATAKKSYLTLKIKAGNPIIELVYYNPTIVRGFTWFRHWLYTTKLGMPQAQTVIITALALSINRGFKQIFLFGADTSWHEQISLDDQNHLVMKQIHFYDKPKDVAFVPVYSDPHRTKTFSMAGQFLSLYKVFRGYEILREYADYKGVRVLNASAKSYIDALERVQFNQSDSQLISELTTEKNTN